MPYYEFACECDSRLEWFSPGEAPSSMIPDCGHEAKRVYSFHHMEDRRHMRGEGISPATGMPYAQSRSEEKRIEREKGIEFVSPSSMPEKWSRLRESAKEAKLTGKHPDPHEINPDTSSVKGAVLQKIKERGVKFG